MKKDDRIYTTNELLEILIIVNLWRINLTQEQMREILRIDIGRISRTAKKLIKFINQNYERQIFKSISYKNRRRGQ